MPQISRRQFAVYLVAVVLVVLLGGRALRADAGPGAPGAAPPEGFTAQAAGRAGDAASGASGPTGAGGLEVTNEVERLVVHVAGAVRRPGVYELPDGARVGDALTEAGGSRAGADLDVLNLAAKVTDGQQVVVTRKGRRSGTRGAIAGASVPGPAGAATAPAPGAAAAPASGAGAGGPTAAAAAVNVNQADATQLEVLDGVGPAIAGKIVDWRTQNGPFRTVDDLALVPGIGPKKLEAMRAQVVT